MDPYRNEIKPFIGKLSKEKQSYFSLLCCERLFNNYVIFSSKYDCGDAAELSNGIDCLSRSIEHSHFDENEIKSIMKSIDEITPNTEDFDTILVSFALDACTSVHESLSFMLDAEVERVIDVATFARDTVDMYIQVKDNLNYNDPHFEQKITDNILMRQEKERQKEHLKILEVNEIGSDLVKKLRVENKNILIIDISLLL